MLSFSRLNLSRNLSRQRDNFAVLSSSQEVQKGLFCSPATLSLRSIPLQMEAVVPRKSSGAAWRRTTLFLDLWIANVCGGN